MSDTCGSEHPERQGVACVMGLSNHSHHVAADPEVAPWPNDAYVPPPKKVSRDEQRDNLTALADRVRGGVEGQMPGGEAVARSGDPATSWMAARSLGDLRTTQANVLRVLAEGPATDEEILSRLLSHSLDETPSGARTRRAELVDAGFVRDTGRKGVTAVGSPSIIWDLTEAGYGLLRPRVALRNFD